MTVLQLYQVYRLLLEELGHQGPWPASGKEEIIAGAILVQNTRWENVQLSLDNISRELAGDFRKISQLDRGHLEKLIRPTGFYTNKSRSLSQVFSWLTEYHFDYQKIREIHQQGLRKQLLSLFGIGQETADVLLLYVFDQTVFISDRYAQKLLGLLTSQSFSSYRELACHIPGLESFSLEEAQQFHLLIDEFGKTYFRDKTQLPQELLEKLKRTDTL